MESPVLGLAGPDSKFADAVIRARQGGFDLEDLDLKKLSEPSLGVPQAVIIGGDNCGEESMGLVQTSKLRLVALRRSLSRAVDAKPSSFGGDYSGQRRAVPISICSRNGVATKYEYQQLEDPFGGCSIAYWIYLSPR